MSEFKLNVAKAVVKILNPIVQILLRHEISYSEFVEIAKRSYVDVAYRYFSIPKRKKTYARVSVITGLNLKEVRRISNASEDEILTTKGPINRAKQVISGWIRDPDFVDEYNKPIVLPLKDEPISFDELVHRYSGDITSGAILDELLRVGAVVKIKNNSIKLVQEALIPKRSEEDMINIIAQHSSDLIKTGVFNMSHEAKDAYFQRQVTYIDVPENVMDDFKYYSRKKSMELLTDFDRWLSENSNKKVNSSGDSTGRVGVGIYYFRNEEKE